MRRGYGRLRACAICIALYAAGALSVGFARADDWEAFQHDPQFTGLSSSTLNPATLAYSWTAPMGYSDPVSDGNSIYAINASLSGNSVSTITSFSAAAGTVNWSASGTYNGVGQMAYGE